MGNRCQRMCPINLYNLDLDAQNEWWGFQAFPCQIDRRALSQWVADYYSNLR